MIVCEVCGEPLADELHADRIVVAGEEIPFRRASDHLACPRCGEMRRVRSLRAEAVASGDLVLDVPPSGALQAAADEAVAALHDRVGTAGDDEEADALLSALSDLARDADPDPDPEPDAHG